MHDGISYLSYILQVSDLLGISRIFFTKVWINDSRSFAIETVRYSIAWFSERRNIRFKRERASRFCSIALLIVGGGGIVRPAFTLRSEKYKLTSCSFSEYSGAGRSSML